MQHETIETECAEIARPSFTVSDADVAALADAVKFLAMRVVERRNSIPILSNVRIDADLSGTVTLTGTDLDLQASVTLSADVAAPGAFTTNAHNLADMLAKAKKAKAREVRLTSEEDCRASLAYGRNRFALNCLPADDFPMIAHPAIGRAGPMPLSRFTVPGPQFIADCAMLAPAMSKEEQRYYLRGMAIQRHQLAGRDSLVMVATDGHAMAVASRPLPDGAAALPDLIIERKTVEAIGHAAKLAGDTPTVRIDAADKMVLAIGHVTLTAKLIDGTYPDWVHAIEAVTSGDDSQQPLFPELLPAAPTAQIERLDKAANRAVKGTVIDWERGADAFTGSVAQDPGLMFMAMAMRGGGCDKKGFEYRWTGQSEAQAWLESRAASLGLPSAADMQDRAFSINDAWGEPDNDVYNSRRAFGHAESHGTRLIVHGTQVIGLTVSGDHRRAGWTETVKDWEALVERTVHHDPVIEPLEGSYSIIMPADGPGTLECASWIEAADGIRYPVADNEKAIHLSAAQVRDLIGESCFETFAVTLDDGETVHVLQWLWDDGCGHFLTVRPDGRCFTGKDAHKARRLSRAEIEAALAGEAEPAAEQPAQPATVPAQQQAEPELAPEDLEPENALSGDCEAISVVTEKPRDIDADPITAAAGLLASIDCTFTLPAIPVEPVTDTPTADTKRKRSPAHERAVRRAWAERSRRRKLDRQIAIGITQFDAMRESRDSLRADYVNLARDHAILNTLHKYALDAERVLAAKRRRTATRARRMILALRNGDTANAIARAERAEAIADQLRLDVGEWQHIAESAFADMDRMQGKPHLKLVA